MHESLNRRTVIVGNGGSGKSTLAGVLSAMTTIPAVNLDDLHWENDGGVYGRKRDVEVAKGLVAVAAAGENWIIEGVYGWLADIALPRATALIWLDYPWSVCRQMLLARGPRQCTDETAFIELLNWAEGYWNRSTSSSYEGHLRLYEKFPRAKWRLKSPDDIEALLGDLSGDVALPPVPSDFC